MTGSPAPTRRRFRLTEDDRTIFRIAIPALGALAADPLVSIVDTAFVGRLGAEPLAALGVVTGLFGFAFFLFNALAYASTPLIARAVGAGDRSDAGRVAGQALFLAAVLGFGGLVLLETAAPAMVRLMGASSDLETMSVEYLRIRGLALPAVLAITVGHGVFRGMANTKTPLYISLGFNLINLVLDPVLIFGFDLGLRGAAIASAVAQLCGGAVFVWFMASGRAGLKIPRGWPGLSSMRVLVSAGSALTVRTLALVTTFTLATAVAARLGVHEIAGHQVASQIWLFLALVVDSIAIAGQTLVAGHLGEGDGARARRLADRMLAWGLSWGIALAVAFWLLRNVLPGWFSSDPQVISVATTLLPFVALTQPLNSIVFVFDGILIGAEQFRFLAAAMVGAAVISCGLLLVAGSITAVWWALTVLMFARVVPMALRYASAVS